MKYVTQAKQTTRQVSRRKAKMARAQCSNNRSSFARATRMSFKTRVVASYDIYKLRQRAFSFFFLFAVLLYRSVRQLRGVQVHKFLGPPDKHPPADTETYCFVLRSPFVLAPSLYHRALALDERFPTHRSSLSLQHEDDLGS